MRKLVTIPDLQTVTLPIGTLTYIDLPAEKARNAAPPLLVLHGWGDRASRWREILHGLRRSERRVLALDLNPSDALTPVASGPLLDYYVTLIAQFIEALELRQVALLGHSLGGLTAALFTASYPAQVERLILADAVRPNGASNSFFVPMANSLARFARGDIGLTIMERLLITEEFVTFWALLTERKMPEATYITQVTANLRDYNRHALIEQTRCVFDYRNMPELCATIEVPTRLIYGSRDTIAPRSHALQYQRDLPHATLHFIEECGHNPQYERPEEFLALILNFLGVHSEIAKQTQ